MQTFRMDWAHFGCIGLAFDPDSPPFPDPGADHGRWRSHADRILEEADHLCRVANSRASQIRRLVEAGVPTLTALAETDLDHVKGMGDPTLENLVRIATWPLS